MGTPQAARWKEESEERNHKPENAYRLRAGTNGHSPRGTEGGKHEKQATAGQAWATAVGPFR